MERSRRARRYHRASGRVRTRPGRVRRASRALRHGERVLNGKRKVIVVCGPTACGKSGLADGISAGIEESSGVYCPVIVVDSMQVYREVPIITNQARECSAELVSVASVTEEWTVACHRELARGIIADARSPVVLDAGTGMYLNSILLDVPLAPKVASGVREEAQRITRGETNPRRASRGVELALSGGVERGSIWDGEPIFDLTILYLRPERSELDERIRERSSKIAGNGVEEAELLLELTRKGTPPNASVRDSIGVRELMGYVRCDTLRDQARSEIETRTRRLARRQMRWFDKLTRTLQRRAEILTINVSSDTGTLQKFHDVIGV